MAPKRIIDIHSHLGDVTRSRNVIFKQNLTMKEVVDPFAKHDAAGFEGPLINDDYDEFVQLVEASEERMSVNSLQNMQKELDAHNITKVCVYPVLPYTTFEEHLACSLMDDRIIPFTSVDTSLKEGIAKKLLTDFRKGARGLKLHAILQNMSLDDPYLLKALEVWETTGCPVVSHCGVNSYFYGDDLKLNTPELGDVKYFIELVRKFPRITFIAAHAGGLTGGEEYTLKEGLTGLDNVYVDTTFRGTADIKRLISMFGEDRVLFGIDGPFSSYGASIKAVSAACAGDGKLENKIFYDNAARILKL